MNICQAGDTTYKRQSPELLTEFTLRAGNGERAWNVDRKAVLWLAEAFPCEIDSRTLRID
jgi:hypothetical protein